MKNMTPPHAIELERKLLSSLLVIKDSIFTIREYLKPIHFYKEEHRAIYEAVLELFRKGKGIDLLTVSEKLKKNKKLDFVGGDIELVNIASEVTTNVNDEHYCLVILEKYAKREMFKLSYNISSNAYKDDVDVFELFEVAYKEMGTITDSLNIHKPLDFKELMLTYFENAAEKSNLPSSISKITHRIGGYKKGELVVVAGRPGMGKTAFALNEILELARLNKPVAFFSLEMSSRQLVSRIMSMVSGIKINKIATDNLNDDERNFLMKCNEKVAELPIFIDETPAISPVELKLKVAKMVSENNVEIIFIDYLQLMRTKSNKSTRNEEVSEISNALKSIAKEFNIPVVALSQLSRSVESRGGNKRPLLSDLRDSGAIEQDADIVMFLYRPEYYKIEQWDDGTMQPTINQADIDIAKNRQGEVGLIRVNCFLEYMRFFNVEDTNEDFNEKFLSGMAVPETVFENLPTMSYEDAFESEEVDDTPF